MWLSYKYGEVAAFHPAFQLIADELLAVKGMDTSHEWIHHPATAGVGVVPDFVLVEKSTGRWLLIVEIKRTPDSVNSERTQIQAKGYAEANRQRFVVGRPVYFAITNLEVTQLFALRGDSPPRDCRVEEMAFESGMFRSTPVDNHRQAFRNDFGQLLNHCLTNIQPVFSTIWPSVVRTVFQHAAAVPFIPGMNVSAGHIPSVVQSYFAGDHEFIARSEVLIRCLLAEYLRGILRRYQHPQSALVRPVGVTLASAANAMINLRRVDFYGVFESTAGQLYVSFESRPDVRAPVQGYLTALEGERVDFHAAERNDAFLLADLLIQEARPASVRDMRGKAATDAELAALLVSLAVTNIDQTVMDPGCGEGNLLTAAYDRFKVLGHDHAHALDRLRGLEVDSLSARIAALRLSIKEPRAVRASDPCHIRIADMFTSLGEIAAADVILMNPPFKRYEAQDEGALPDELRHHIFASIEGIEGKVDVAQGQPNLLAFYAEFIVKAAKPGATLAFILDNKWFHNGASSALRQLFLQRCKILCVVTYPHGRFFEGIMIATSIVVMVKEAVVADHLVSFVRVDDPATADADAAAAAIRGGATPEGWTIRRVQQAEMTAASWKKHLSDSLVHEFRTAPLSRLPELFAQSRRGSLAKEGGGIAVYEFPRNRSNYGPRRLFKPNGASFQTISGAPITPLENESIRQVAAAIPDAFLGYAINKADRVAGYVLSVADVTIDQTIELPEQRLPPYSALYSRGRRAPWNEALTVLTASIASVPALSSYVEAIETVVGLDDTVLPTSQLWNVLREPYAGELIVPRKLRDGHHVHINPFAFVSGRQVRLSSNFLSYGNCLAVDLADGLDGETATTLIAAWLVSSFGHVQFELESNNREGLRTIEQADADRIWVIDPRAISRPGRDRIITAFRTLPYSIRTDLRPELQPELSGLDEVFADELARLLPSFARDAGLDEVWNLLHTLHETRRP